MQFSLSSQDGNWRVTLDPATHAGQWMRVATVSATAGTALSVNLTGQGEGLMFADASAWCLLRRRPTRCTCRAAGLPPNRW